MKIDRCLESGHSELVAAQRAEEGLAFQRADQSFFTDDDAGLRPAKKFVAAETNEVRSGAQRLRGSGFAFAELLDLIEQTAAKIDNEWDAALMREHG